MPINTEKVSKASNQSVLVLFELCAFSHGLMTFRKLSGRSKSILYRLISPDNGLLEGLDGIYDEIEKTLSKEEIDCLIGYCDGS